MMEIVQPHRRSEVKLHEEVLREQNSQSGRTIRALYRTFRCFLLLLLLLWFSVLYITPGQRSETARPLQTSHKRKMACIKVTLH